MRVALILLLALSVPCFAEQGFAESITQLEPDYTGRQAMLIDGKRVGKLERQADGTYLLRYPQGDAVKCSINEVILMPEVKQ